MHTRPYRDAILQGFISPIPFLLYQSERNMVQLCISWTLVPQATCYVTLTSSEQMFSSQFSVYRLSLNLMRPTLLAQPYFFQLAPAMGIDFLTLWCSPLEVMAPCKAFFPSNG